MALDGGGLGRRIEGGYAGLVRQAVGEGQEGVTPVAGRKHHADQPVCGLGQARQTPGGQAGPHPGPHQG